LIFRKQQNQKNRKQKNQKEKNVAAKQAPVLLSYNFF
jgi:hypothetical protein